MLQNDFNNSWTTSLSELSTGQTLAGDRFPGVGGVIAKRHLADLRARSGLSTEQLIYRGRAEGWLVVPSLDLETTGSAPCSG